MKAFSSVDDYSILLGTVALAPIKQNEIQWKPRKGAMWEYTVKYMTYDRVTYLFCSNIYTDLFTFVI